MTDPVEALAAAIKSPRKPGMADHPMSYNDVARNEARCLLAALRASGFDVVPTGDALHLCEECGADYDDLVRRAEEAARVVPTGDAGLDAAARGAWQAWDDAMEHADDDGFVDSEWWAPLVGAMDALYDRLSSSEPGTPQMAAVLLSDLDNDPAYLQGVKDGRAARDAEWRTEIHKVFDDPTRPIWPEGAPRFAAMFAILDADTPS